MSAEAAAAGLEGLRLSAGSDAAACCQTEHVEADAVTTAARQLARQQRRAAKKLAREASRKRNLLVRGDPRERMRQAAQEQEQSASAGGDIAVAAEGSASDAAAPWQPGAGRAVSLREQTPSLRQFSLALLPPPSPCPGNERSSHITSLDLSHNELAAIDGLAALTSLASLDVSRNWLRSLPKDLSQLPGLVALNASRNFLRPNAEFLLLLPSLTALQGVCVCVRVAGGRARARVSHLPLSNSCPHTNN